jgi:hypothetical protein
MVNSLENMRITTGCCAIRVGLVLLVMIAAIAAGVFFAHITRPSLGEACSIRHSVSRDAEGHTMWCDRATIGHNELVWQYNWV